MGFGMANSGCLPDRVLKAMEMLRGFGTLGNVASFVLPKDELIEGAYDEAKSHWKFQ